MKTYFNKHPFAVLGLFIVPLLACVIGMKMNFPKASSSYDNFIIAFEFIQTPTECNTLLKNISSEALDKLDMGNCIDFSFMFCYAVFIIAWFWQTKETYGFRWAKVGMLLGVVAFFADLLENLQLLELTRLFRENAADESLQPIIEKLQIFTWTKWLALAVAMLLAVKVFWKSAKWHKGLSLLLILPAILAIGAFTHDPLALHCFVLSTFGGFLALFVHCFSAKKIRN